MKLIRNDNKNDLLCNNFIAVAREIQMKNQSAITLLNVWYK